MAGAHQDQAVVLVPPEDALLEAMGQSPYSCVSPCSKSNTKQSSVIPPANSLNQLLYYNLIMHN